jgi:hypothetical protein
MCSRRGVPFVQAQQPLVTHSQTPHGSTPTQFIFGKPRKTASMVMHRKP